MVAQHNLWHTQTQQCPHKEKGTDPEGVVGSPRGWLQPRALTPHHQLCHCATRRARCGEDGETCWCWGACPEHLRSSCSHTQNPSDSLALLSELPALSIFGLLSRKRELRMLWRSGSHSPAELCPREPVQEQLGLKPCLGHPGPSRAPGKTPINCSLVSP